MASTATPDDVRDALRKTDTRLRQLVRSLKDYEPKSEEVQTALRRAKKRAKDNREILDPSEGTAEDAESATP
jgi:hypothetical protein